MKSGLFVLFGAIALSLSVSNARAATCMTCIDFELYAYPVQNLNTAAPQVTPFGDYVGFGKLCYDAGLLTGVGLEAITGYDDPNTSFTVTIIGYETVDEQDARNDLSEPGYPYLGFSDGVLSGISFATSRFYASSTNFSYNYGDIEGDIVFGEPYSDCDKEPEPVGVPTPAAAGAGLALLGAMGLKRRRTA